MQALRTRIDDEAVPHLREALELDALPMLLRLVLDTGPNRRRVA